MTAHKYYKRGLVTAEKFDGTNVMADKYGLGPSLEYPESSMWWAINTLEGQLTVKPGDWIATGVNGERWPIADDIFKKTYTPLPVIPQAVGEVIRKHREAGRDLAYALYKAMRVYSRRGRADGKSVYSWIANNQDIFALAWLLGEWEEEQ